MFVANGASYSVLSHKHTYAGVIDRICVVVGLRGATGAFCCHWAFADCKPAISSARASQIGRRLTAVTVEALDAT